jgi:hypothetical protein
MGVLQGMANRQRQNRCVQHFFKAGLCRMCYTCYTIQCLCCSDQCTASSMCMHLLVL